jgi:predicted membrane protein
MRSFLEIIGLIFCLAAQVLAVILYGFGESVLPSGFHGDTLPPYIATIVLGYAFCAVVLALARGKKERLIELRARFDAFLAATPLAALLSFVLMSLNLPLHLQGWNAHAFGVSGGTGNIIFFPWLHGFLTLAIIRIIKART